MGSSVRIVRIAGIQIRISASWLLIFALVVWELGWQLFPAAVPGHPRSTYVVMAVVAALAFFASIVAHELAHAVVARRRGIGVESVTLFLFGGVATLTDEARTARDELAIAIAGPLMSLMVCGASIGAGVGLDALGVGGQVTEVVLELGVVNGMLAVFNLLPGFPLDGGRILRAAVWARTGDLARATRAAAVGGRLLGGLLIAGGVLRIVSGDSWGIWLLLIGWFVIGSATQGERQSALRHELRNATAGDLMTPNPLGLDPEITLQEAVEDYFSRHSHPVYPVRDVLTPLGLLTIDRVREFDPDQWPTVPVRQAMLPLAGAVVSPATSVLELLPRLRSRGRLLVVDDDGDLRGILALADVSAWLQRLRPGPSAR